MYLKIALGNIRRAFSDYSVYFLTLMLAACLLYAFTSSMDYLLALDLTDRQRDLCASSANITEAFSVFMVIVFAFLVLYANRFILRRRSREFALYGILGMGGARVSLILLLEGVIVGIVALVCGIALGILASPLFGVVAAFVFNAPWGFVLEVFPRAIVWTSGCFCGLMLVATLLGMRSMRKKSLLELLSEDRTPQATAKLSRIPRVLQPIVGFALNLVVWYACLFNLGLFLGFIVPLGVAATIGTGLIFRYFSARIPERRARRRPNWYWHGLNSFVTRQIEWKVGASSTAMACTCVLMAVAICMMAAGLAFSVGMRLGTNEVMMDALSPIGYIGIFYGLTFLVTAAAVLALQQLSEGVESIERFKTLAKLGTSEKMLKGAVRKQAAVYFAAPFAGALVHCIFGLALIAFLAFALGSGQFPVIVGATIGITFLLMVAYYALTCHQCTRMLVK